VWRELKASGHYINSFDREICLWIHNDRFLRTQNVNNDLVKSMAESTDYIRKGILHSSTRHISYDALERIKHIKIKLFASLEKRILYQSCASARNGRCYSRINARGAQHVLIALNGDNFKRFV